MNILKNFFLQLPKQHKILLSVISIFCLFLLIFSSERATASKPSKVTALEVGKRYQLEIPAEPVALENALQELPPLEDTLNWQLAIVKSGDSLAKIFKRHQLSAATTHHVVNAEGAKQYLVNLNIGDELRIGKDEQGQLIQLVYPLNKTKIFTVNYVDGSYQTSLNEKQVDVQIAQTSAEITSNFWNAAIDAGMSSGQIMDLANIFGWDIDFALDIRAGDNFSVVYEKQFVDGEYIGDGQILAAEFTNQNEAYKAIRFTDGEYYTPEGNNMRKTFLRAPVNFKYISSSFKKKRFHPIQKRWKAHNGVDYRASKGTPVVAAGSGRVTHSTYNRFNGNYVFIQHGDGIVTKYLHFSKRAVKKGQRVKQGQVIGYVGSTGMSQAPHLHYEFLVNGVHRNPRTVKLPKSKPINSEYLADFKVLAKERLALLEGSKKTLLAKR